MVTTIDEYILGFPESTQILLHQMRKAVKEGAPKAVEAISYGMPAFRSNGKVLVYFAAFKNHIGFYATPTGHYEFRQELSGYKQGKGSVQFPIDKPLPLDLIKNISAFRYLENENKFNKK